MKITGKLVDILVNLHQDIYGDCIVLEKGNKVLYVEILKAIYGMLETALLWYQTFRKDLEEHRFIFNNYDPCVANKIVNDKQQMIQFHIDDIMSNHVAKIVSNKFLI